MSDRESDAASTLDHRTRRLLGHLSLVGLFLEDRSSARERLEAKIGDLTPFCLAQASADSPKRVDSSGPGQVGLNSRQERTPPFAIRKAAAARADACDGPWCPCCGVDLCDAEGAAAEGEWAVEFCADGSVEFGAEHGVESLVCSQVVAGLHEPDRG